MFIKIILLGCLNAFNDKMRILVEMYEMYLIVRVAEVADIWAGMRGTVISVIRTRAVGGQGASTLDLRLGQGKVNVGKEGKMISDDFRKKEMVHALLPNIYFSLVKPEIQCGCSLPPDNPRPDDRDHRSPNLCPDVRHLCNPHNQIRFVHLHQHHI